MDEEQVQERKPIELEGYLQKEGQKGLVKLWKHRWFSTQVRGRGFGTGGENKRGKRRGRGGSFIHLSVLVFSFFQDNRLLYFHSETSTDPVGFIPLTQIVRYLPHLPFFLPPFFFLF